MIESRKHNITEDFQAKILVFCAITFSILFNGYFLIVKGTYRGTYDSYVHMFFASKYKRIFGVAWVYNWFEGFELVSYPPLIPQLLSLASKFTDIDSAYILLQIVAIVLTVTGAYRFCRLWVGPVPAGYAAFSAALISSVAQQAHQFGQLPTCFASGLTLHAAYHFAKWCGSGSKLHLFGGIISLTMVTLAHHLTLFLFVPAIFLVVASTLFVANANQHGALRTFFTRVLIFFAFDFFVTLLVLYPFLNFVLHDLPKQAEIPHATRLNYLRHLPVFGNFFLVPLATTAVGFLLAPGLFKRYSLYRPLIMMIFVTTIFGLGGTTPIPRLVLGKYWGIFTYDRFAAWTALLLLPILGWAFAAIKRPIYRWVLLFSQLFILLGCFYFIGGIKFQPDPIDLRPVAKFLNNQDRKMFRYLTLGLGSQMAKLSYLTDAPSVDGLYFTARTSKILRESGIEAIDSNKYFGDKGRHVLEHYLSSPERYSLKYVVVNDAYYEKFLMQFNWRPLNGNYAGLRVWEAGTSIRPLPSSFFERRSQVRPLSQFLWGFGVISCFFLILIEIYIVRVEFGDLKRLGTDSGDDVT